MKKRRKGNLLQRMPAMLLYAVLITGITAGAVPAQGTTHECFVSYTIWGYDENAAFSGEAEKIEIKDSSDNIWTGTRNTVELEFSTGDNAYQIITRFTLPNGTYQLYMDEQLIEVGQGSSLTTEFTYTDSDGSGYSLYSERYFAVRFHDGDKLLNTQYILNGQAASAPATPEKDGYTFAGWVTEDGGSTQFDFNSGISNITDAYASWTITKPAAKSGEGSREKSCNICGYKETEVIPKTGGGDTDNGSHTADTKKDNEPNTGDTTPIKIYAAVATAAGLSYLLLLFGGRKRSMAKQEKKELQYRQKDECGSGRTEGQGGTG